MAKAPRYEGLERDTSLKEAARAVLGPLLAAVLQEAPAVLRGDDVEATHNMRVALRRLRVALATFRDCFPKKRLREQLRTTKRIGRKLGEVRDADVHLAALRTALGSATSDEHAGVAHALEKLAAGRREALAAFAIELSQFDRAGLAELIESDGKAAEAPLRSVLPRILRRRLRRLLEEAEDARESGAPSDLHALRIEGKHLRYNLEFFREPLGPASADALTLLAHLQERLGTIADLDAFERYYRGLLEGVAGDDPRAAGLRARLTAARRERERALDTLRHRWLKAQPPYPERLTASISASLASLSPSSAS
ncbi:MAG: CHAD domain-containing protein [Candidatus Baltobacteraceae bacterium]